jgi:membrane protein DedA with SNARE-associated domain
VAGATLWNSLLAYSGYILGKNWDQVRHYSEYFSIVVAAILLIAGICFVYRHINNKTQEKKVLHKPKF